MRYVISAVAGATLLVGVTLGFGMSQHTATAQTPPAHPSCQYLLGPGSIYNLQQIIDFCGGTQITPVPTATPEGVTAQKAGR
jgi:hypothetical protein